MAVSPKPKSTEKKMTGIMFPSASDEKIFVGIMFINVAQIPLLDLAALAVST